MENYMNKPEVKKRKTNPLSNYTSQSPDLVQNSVPLPTSSSSRATCRSTRHCESPATILSSSLSD